MHLPATQSQCSYFSYPSFPFVAPPQLRGQADRYPVVIAGGGPSGLVLALELARCGIRSVVLEADETVSEGSRAACVSRRSMEILQLNGVADDFLKQALPWTHGTSYYRSAPIYRLEMPHSAHERFYPMANLQQNMFEALLVERAHAQADLIDIRWQSQAVSVEQDADEIRLRVDTPQGDYVLRAYYLVAADGARSSLRAAMGLRLAGESFEGRYLIADIKMASPYPTERRAWFDPPTNPGNTVLMHKMARDVWRIDYQLDDAADEVAELQPDRVSKRIAQHLDWIGETTPWQLDWIRLYKAHCLCLDDYKQGRVFFIGDAAHLVPIFGVRGMNSSIADANNLGWKLAAVLNGQARPGLLDSYSPERRAATLDIFTNARKSTVFMTPPSSGYRLLRDAALQLAIDHDWAKRFVNPRQSAPYDYADSAWVTADSARWQGGPAPGAPMVCVRLSDGSFLTDWHDGRFMLLLFGQVADGLTAALLQQRAIGTRVIAAHEQAAFERYDAHVGAAYLIRPDGHVAARFRQANVVQVGHAIDRALAIPISAHSPQAKLSAT
jgi:3-(3-hydroxy-phenyl)propionate hydroxylase